MFVGNNKLRSSLSIKNIVEILFGTFIYSIGINTFIVHARLLSGGVSGISLIVQYLTGLPAGYTIFILNIPLLILSYKKIGLRFTMYTVMGTLSLSLFLILTQFLDKIINFDDPILLCLYGGVLTGAGMGIVFANHGSTGGLDIISVLVKKKYENFELGKTNLYINFFIVLAGAIFIGLKSALYTLVSMSINSFVLDKTINGFNRRKMLFIITNEEEKISNAIMNDLKRGVTFIQAEGAYTKTNRRILYCVVSLSQIPYIKHLVYSIDSNAFISILDVSEVRGKGFMDDLF
ncbi:YitT family protein [Thermoanaerobacterium sp. CMT5567-10]|uniref:YitT family protein n=1 Tax=Thermoanaerobacterium sp. CMT5567-10 TaxID=3061989 RepID=UPI0026DFD3E4|nr:YitT family protein [Thermoanaerobacterium sp. CMT5567-10]WKV09636.1 YitT family protein [Thermoanaerobacterium sp. CMT5567-10]